MAMKIPSDALIVQDRRLDLIRILSTLTAEGGRLDQLKNAVKKTLADKNAGYAQSDLVNAKLGNYTPRQFVDPKKLRHLVKTKRISLDQYDSAICVRTSVLPKFLGENEIAEIYLPPAKDADSSTAAPLFTEFKSEVLIDWDAVEAAILESAKK